MLNEQTGETWHLTGLRNKFSSIIIILIKKKDQNNIYLVIIYEFITGIFICIRANLGN
jgi:hypothetical protein